tara:strand:- start:9188 stop:11212 length:2025 start_codon:yes stop_codon:yes gene_type:complete
MQLLKFVPIKLTLFLVAGIIAGHYLNATIFIPLLATILLLVLLGVFVKIKKTTTSIYFGITALLLMFAIGFLAITMANPKNNSNHYSKYTTTQAQKISLKIIEVLKPTRFSTRYIAKVKRVGNTITSGDLIINLALDTTKLPLKVDDELVVFEKLSPIHSPLNPHQFNYKKYVEGLGIYHQINLNTTAYILTKNPSKTFYGIAASWRTQIISNLKEENFGTEELSIIQALLLGQRNDISEETYTNYKNAGAIHILAVSGLHIGILLLLLQFLLQPLEQIPFGKTIKLTLIVVLLWTFAFLAGLSASIVRAVTMFTFLAYSQYLNRAANTFNILALSMFFILLFKPSYLFQVGFQMSYAAVFAIIWIYPMLQRFWFPKHIVIRKIWQLSSVSIAAQLGVLPISLFYFHQFPGLFFISNLLIIPCLGLILVGGIIVVTLSLFHILPSFITKIYNVIIEFMNTIIERIAAQEAFLFKDISFDSMQLVLVYILILFLVQFSNKPSFKKGLTFLLLLIALQTWSFYSYYTASKKEVALVFHQSRNSALLVQKGTTLHLLSTKAQLLEKHIINYKITERTNSIIQSTLRNSYTIGEKKLYILDSLAIYPPKNTKTTYLLITQSPKINLERFLDSIKPQFVIADGSNYKSDITRWKATCAKKKLPFHYTGEKGAYYFNMND